MTTKTESCTESPLNQERPESSEFKLRTNLTDSLFFHPARRKRCAELHDKSVRMSTQHYSKSILLCSTLNHKYIPGSFVAKGGSKDPAKTQTSDHLKLAQARGSNQLARILSLSLLNPQHGPFKGQNPESTIYGLARDISACACDASEQAHSLSFCERQLLLEEVERLLRRNFLPD